ncbi:hypothetical protein [Brevibacillus formosus]|uniref:hypothetical protein n=1 Tax=Brevibacillus formosus TaxID=54913 RepID=UPI003F1D6D8A
MGLSRSERNEDRRDARLERRQALEAKAQAEAKKSSITSSRAQQSNTNLSKSSVQKTSVDRVDISEAARNLAATVPKQAQTSNNTGKFHGPPVPTKTGSTQTENKSDKNSSNLIYTAGVGALTGGISKSWYEYKEYQNRVKVQQAAVKQNGPTSAPRIAPYDFKGSTTRGAGIGAAVAVATETAKNIYNKYDNISKTKGTKEAIAQAVEDKFIAPFEPYASMPTPKEIRNSKDKNDRKESISDRIGREVRNAKEKIKDIFKW